MGAGKSGNDFSVVLEKVGNQPLMTTKTLMRATGLGLSDAKKMVDKAPTTVATGIDSNKAIALKKELEALGNTVSIPGMEMKAATSTSTKKTTEAKKTTVKKSEPSPLTIALPSNDAFDAIFGSTAPKTETKSQVKNSGAKIESTVKKDERAQTDLENALAKALEIVGKDGFLNGDRVCNLLSDLVPKLEKDKIVHEYWKIVYSLLLLFLVS